MIFDYDNANKESIFAYAKKLEGRTFRLIVDEFKKTVLSKTESEAVLADQNNNAIINRLNNIKIEELYDSKGQLGNLLEKYYFGYLPNSKQEADFSKVGIELKQTPIDKMKNGELRAGERLSITKISFREPIIQDFFKSHVWDKIKLILLIQYIRDKNIDRLDYVIQFVNLFTPPAKDLKIIIEDYNKINSKIKAGLAHELSESDTLYLGACTK